MTDVMAHEAIDGVAIDTIEAGAIDAIVNGRHGDAFSVLGPHPDAQGMRVRAMLPGADSVELIDPAGRSLGAMQRIDGAGLFSGLLPAPGPYRLRVQTHGLTYETEDAYRFGPTLGALDLHLLTNGVHRDVGLTLGAHEATYDGVAGVRFAVWAPNAQRVSVVGDFNFWDARRHPMRKQTPSGVWEMFVPRRTTRRHLQVRPPRAQLGRRCRRRPIRSPGPPNYRRPRDRSSLAAHPSIGPMAHGWSIVPAPCCRMHRLAPMRYTPPRGCRPAEAGSDGWDALADRLVPYCAGMGFTHVELLPVMEHPFGGSWGYQPLGQYAPSAALGSPDGFKRFVDRCHAMGVGVLLDWVPAHFPTDAHGLARFDGTPLYEHGDPREGFHRDWNTYIYNLGRNEVKAWMISSGLWWLTEYHCDGLRVDAVASMLYRDYSRNAGEWVPNQFGGRENLESVAFLQELSRAVADRAPGAILIAEESTAWPGVTKPADEGGLGFHYKWNMGWMHDTLHYMEEQPVYRRWHHGEITFGLVYAFSEKFMLPLSHDEVVYGKGSLIRKMPGDAWQKFASLRAYFGFMWTHPGKKLLFMGGEIAQDREWNHDTGLDWHLLDDPANAGVQRVLRDLNAAYRDIPALHEGDCDPAGFRWVVIDDADNSVFAYLRYPLHGGAPALVVCNFTPVPRHSYRLGVPHGGRWTERINTDAAVYGGSNTGNGGMVWAEDTPMHGLAATLSLTLPPLATLVLMPE